LGWVPSPSQSRRPGTTSSQGVGREKEVAASPTTDTRYRINENGRRLLACRSERLLADATYGQKSHPRARCTRQATAGETDDPQTGRQGPLTAPHRIASPVRRHQIYKPLVAPAKHPGFGKDRLRPHLDPSQDVDGDDGKRTVAAVGRRHAVDARARSTRGILQQRLHHASADATVSVLACRTRCQHAANGIDLPSAEIMDATFALAAYRASLPLSGPLADRTDATTDGRHRQMP